MISESLTVGLKASNFEHEETNVGMRLYYGTRDNLVQELSYNLVNKTWQSGFSFTKSNGNSGIALAGSVGGTLFIHYMVCLNSAYQLEVWWKDMNKSSVASQMHPIGVWTRGMWPSTDMASRL